MQKIIVNLSSLKAKLLEAEKEDMDIMELCIVASQMEDEISQPAFLHFEGISKNGTHKDYESIDEFLILERLLIDKSA